MAKKIDFDKVYDVKDEFPAKGSLIDVIVQSLDFNKLDGWHVCSWSKDLDESGVAPLAVYDQENNYIGDIVKWRYHKKGRLDD